MFGHKTRLNSIVISILVVIINSVKCDEPDICYGSGVQTIERVVFRDDIHRYFVSSGRYYWFVNETNDLPTSDTALQLPYGFEPDVALTRDTEGCPGGLYSLLLIQRKLIIGTNEEEWLTMDYSIGSWGENGTDAGQWEEPVRIARCSLDSAVCSTSDNYFATMNFNFKRSLDAAFGVIGRNAFFIQDSLIYNVSYKTRCVEHPYSQVFAQSPKPLSTRVSAGALIGDQTLLLFDREFYANVTDFYNITDDDLSDDKWTQTPHNFFTACPPLAATLGSFLYDIFTDSRSRTMTATVLIVIIIVFILIVISVVSLLVWMSLRRKTMRITKNSENADTSSDSPLHEEHLLKSDSPKDVAKDSNKDPNQVRIPLQTSC